MVFNVVFANYDDHLKNHSFIYNELNNKWYLAPAYDLTYSLNPMLNFNLVSRALSINNKRVDIQLQDLLSIAEKYTIKNPKGIIRQVQNLKTFWREQAHLLGISDKVILNIEKEFCEFQC
jgi:serine/threonine-protein kinase HipA